MKSNNKFVNNVSREPILNLINYVKFILNKIDEKFATKKFLTLKSDVIRLAGDIQNVSSRNMLDSITRNLGEENGLPHYINANYNITADEKAVLLEAIEIINKMYKPTKAKLEGSQKLATNENENL